MVCYDVDFLAIISYKMYERAFGETTILTFPCLVKFLYDEAGVLEIPGVDTRV